MTEVAGRRFRLASPATANALGALVLMLLGVTVTLAVLIHQLTILNVTTGLTFPLIYAAAGVIVARHQPRNPVGWILIIFVVLLLAPLDAGYHAVLRYRLGYHGLALGPAEGHRGSGLGPRWPGRRRDQGAGARPRLGMDKRTQASQLQPGHPYCGALRN